MVVTLSIVIFIRVRRKMIREIDIHCVISIIFVKKSVGFLLE